MCLRALILQKSNADVELIFSTMNNVKSNLTGLGIAECLLIIYRLSSQKYID